MIRYTISQAIAHRVRLALTFVAVMLGVAFVASSLILNDTAQQLFDQQFRTASAGADLTVRTATAFDSGMGVEVQRDPMGKDVLRRVAAVSGVTAAIPVAQGSIRLEHNGIDLGAGQLTTWVAPPIGAFSLAAGHAPSTPGDIVMDVAGARRLGLHLGDAFDVLGETHTNVRLVGLARFGTADGPPVGTAVLTSLATAQRTLALGPKISEVLVKSGRPVADIKPILTQTLGKHIQVASAKDLAAAGAEAAASNLKLLQIILVAMSIAALIIGSLLIANTFSIVVSQRTRELAIVRAAGATGGQVMRSVLLEAAIVGTVASAAGVTVGAFGTLGLRALARTFGVILPNGPLVFELRTVLFALALGIVITLLATIGPARRAARVSPVLAMRATAAEARSFGRGRIGTAIGLLTVGAASAIAPSLGAPLILLALGLAIALTGGILITPVIIRPFVRLIGAPAASSVAGRLARDSALRAPRRTSATVMALALGLALLSFVTIVGASVRTATEAQYREVITADAVIESAGDEMLGGVQASVYDELNQVSEVGEATRLKYGHWKDGEMITALSAIDPLGIQDVAAFRMIHGRLADLKTGGVIVSARTAKERNLHVGNRLPMTFARTGAHNLPIVGIVSDTTEEALQTDYFVSLDTYSKNYTENMDASIFVRAAKGVTPAELAGALRKQLADHPTVQVRNEAEVIAGRTMAVDQIFGLVTVLLAFALMIAVLGIANTLALSIVERTREIGLLRAVGASRKSIALMVLLEAIIVSVVAIVTGTLIGVLASIATVGALGHVAPLTMTLPAVQLGILAAVVALAGLVAGIAPARRAARVPVLEAIADV